MLFVFLFLRFLLLDRPFPAVEKVLVTVMETGKYSQLSKDSGLVVKENYIEQKLQAHVSALHSGVHEPTVHGNVGDRNVQYYNGR